MIAIPEKCYTCRKRIGYMITGTDDRIVRQIVSRCGLFQQCEECFVQGKTIS